MSARKILPCLIWIISSVAFAGQPIQGVWSSPCKTFGDGKWEVLEIMADATDSVNLTVFNFSDKDCIQLTYIESMTRRTSPVRKTWTGPMARLE